MDRQSAELAKHVSEKAAVSYTCIYISEISWNLVFFLGITSWDMCTHTRTHTRVHTHTHTHTHTLYRKVSPTFCVHQCLGWWRVYHVSRETQWRRGPTLSHWRPWRCRTLSLHPWLARSVDRALTVQFKVHLHDNSVHVDLHIQLMRPGISQNVSCAVPDFLFVFREVWFIYINAYL